MASVREGPQGLHFPTPNSGPGPQVGTGQWPTAFELGQPPPPPTSPDAGASGTTEAQRGAVGAEEGEVNPAAWERGWASGSPGAGRDGAPRVGLKGASEPQAERKWREQ